MRRKWNNNYRKRKKVHKFVMEHGKMMWFNCWLADRKYKMLDGFCMYQKWASGEGDVVRHLCGDARCVNPLHLRRGTDIENAQDEVDVRHFTIKAFEDILDDYSVSESGVSKELQFYIVVPRLAAKMRMRKLTDAIDYGRHLFRINFVNELVEAFRNEDLELFKLLSKGDNEKLYEALRSRYDVEIIFTKEVF